MHYREAKCESILCRLLRVILQVAGESSKAKKAEEQVKTAPEPPLDKAIVDHFSETLLPGRSWQSAAAVVVSL